MKIRTQMITGFSLLAVLVGVMQAIDYRSNLKLTQMEEQLHHTHTVIASAKKFEKLIVDMETGMRGFLLTGEETFLKPYHQASKLHVQTLFYLKALVSDNPSQTERLTDMEEAITRWNKEVAAPLIRKRMDGVPLAEIQAAVRSMADKGITDQLRQQVEEFIVVEEALLNEHHRQTEAAQLENHNTLIGGTLFFFLLAIIITITITRSIYKKVGGEPDTIEAITKQVAAGNLEEDSLKGNNTGILAAVKVMRESLKKKQQKINDSAWISTCLTGLDDAMRGLKKLDVLCDDIITYLARTLDIQVGTLSLANTNRSRLDLAASYAYKEIPGTPAFFLFGEGLIGQAAQEKKQIVVRDVKESHITVKSALGEIVPNSILCAPLLYEEDVKGVVELGSLHTFTDLQLEFMNQAAERIAIAIHTVQTREKMKELLEKSQAQTEELQAQSEELRVSNEEMVEKAEELAAKQTQLKQETREI